MYWSFLWQENKSKAFDNEKFTLCEIRKLNVLAV
jgi:hypothetical protein